jgi:hypothetical protein
MRIQEEVEDFLDGIPGLTGVQRQEKNDRMLYPEGICFAE